MVPDSHIHGVAAQAASYWSRPTAELLSELGSGPAGLDMNEAKGRLASQGPNVLETTERATALKSFLRQFRNPIVLILLFATTISFFVREWVDGGIILAIVFGSALLTFKQEYSANRATEKIRQRTALKTRVWRDGRELEVPAEDLVCGDIVVLSAGSLVPADGVLLEATDCYVSQAVLTGETFPVSKKPGEVPADADLASRVNCVFMGTNVRSGTAQLLVTATGAATALGQIAGQLASRAPETEFERGVRRFGYLLAEVMFVLVIAIFAINVYFHKPVMESLALLGRPRRGSDPPAPSGDHQPESRERRTVHGGRRCPGAQAQCDRELRQHGRALHGQDRHADRRRGEAGRRPGCRGRALAGSVSLRVLERQAAERTGQSPG